MAVGYLSELEPSFFESKSFLDIASYRQEIDSIQDAEEYGVYLDDGAYFKDMYVNDRNYNGYLKTRVTIEPVVGSDTYMISFQSVPGKVNSDQAIYSIVSAMGLSADTSLINQISSYVSNTPEIASQFVDGAISYVIDEYGQSKFDTRLLDLIYEYLQVEYYPISNKYEAESKQYPDGQYTLVDYGIDSYAPTIAANTSGWGNLGISGTAIGDYLTELAQTEQFKEIVSQYPCIRTIYCGADSPVAGQKFVIIEFYSIDNNSIVVTNEGNGRQHYSALCTAGVRYSIERFDSQNPTGLQGPTTITGLPTSKTFFNYKATSPTLWTHQDFYIDSIGWIGDLKPYDITGITPNNQPRNERYPLWTDTVTIIDPDDEPTPPEQTIIWKGILKPYIKIVPFPIIGLLPVPIIDIKYITKIERPDPNHGELYHIFDAEDTTLTELSDFLWEENLIERLTRIFKNNPIDCIISLHQVYYVPEIAEAHKEIVLGYIETAIFDNPITKRYQQLNFGAIFIPRTFHDIRDFQRDISIFLPYIGIRQLDVTDITGNDISGKTRLWLTYMVDNLTGDVVAEIRINRDGLTDDKLLYSFNGNCASQLPLTGADRSNLLTSSLSAIGGIASTVLTGGATAPALIGSAVGVASNMGASIQRTGNITGNHGAMGCQTAYVIINNPIKLDAYNFSKYAGNSSNVTTTLRYCNGFTRMEECFIENIPCTTNESDSIRALLASGIIV